MFSVWPICSAGVTCTWRRKLVCLRLFPATLTVSREYAHSLFFFLRREMKAHLPDYPAALSISARLLWCSVYIREITPLRCFSPWHYPAALCISTRWPCCTVYPRGYHAALCVYTRLPWCTVCFHEITMLNCVYPRDDHAALCISARLPCFSLYIDEMTMLHCVYTRDYYAELCISRVSTLKE